MFEPSSKAMPCTRYFYLYTFLPISPYKPKYITLFISWFQARFYQDQHGFASVSEAIRTPVVLITLSALVSKVYDWYVTGSQLPWAINGRGRWIQGALFQLRTSLRISCKLGESWFVYDFVWMPKYIRYTKLSL